MTWWKSVVQIRSGARKGSGVFVAPDLILTAGHLVRPAGGPSAAPSDLDVIIRYLERRCSVVRTIEHVRWSRDQVHDCDMALLVVEPQQQLGVPALHNFGADLEPHGVRVHGYRASDDETWSAAGPAERVTQVHGYHMLHSDDLNPPPGVSGAPILYGRGDDVAVVGIATCHQEEDRPPLLGLPLSDLSFGVLMDQATAT